MGSHLALLVILGIKGKLFIIYLSKSLNLYRYYTHTVGSKTACTG